MKKLYTGKKARRSAGFTMTELMICVAIIGITVGTASMEVLRNRPTHNLNKACWEIMSELRMARTSAVSENKDCVFTLDSDTKTLTVGLDRNDDGSISEDEERVTDLSEITGITMINALGDESGTFTGQGNFEGQTMTTQILVVAVPNARETKWITIYPTGQIQMRNQ